MLVKPVHHDNRLLGVVQMINRTDDFSYSSGDESVLAYVSDKLGDFLAQSKAAGDKPKKRAPGR
jgi:signal transduction protein with GAF and PtsI domain